MDNEEIMLLSDEITSLRERQRKVLAFTTSEFIELRAMLGTIIYLQRIALAQSIGEPPTAEPALKDVRIEELLAGHRAKHAQIVRKAVEELGLLDDSPRQRSEQTY